MTTLADVAFLTSVRGQELLNRLADEDLSPANTLSLVSTLRRQFTADEVSAALTQATVRQKASDKFGPYAADLLLTDSALQQASDRLVRLYRAQQVAAGSSVLDLCCGIGADSFAFASRGCRVTGLDIDPVRVEMARWNASVLGLNSVQFAVADVTTANPSSGMELVFFDPGRRSSDGRRIHNVYKYQPPLNTIDRYRPLRRWAKISPGVDMKQLNDEAAAIEFISVEGDLKEAMLYYDEDTHQARAVRLSEQNDKLVADRWTCQQTLAERPLSAPLTWLIEPDPALIRAGLIEDAAQVLGAFQLDATIAYLTASEAPASDWFRCWRVLDWMPFQLKRLRAYLRERHIGRITVKKRGSPITPEELSAKLKLKGSEACTLVLTRYRGEPIVIVCADYTG